VGRVLSRRLLARGSPVTVLDLMEPQVLGVNWVPGQTGDEEALREVVENADIVTFLATGALEGWAGLQETEIAGVIRALEHAVGVGRVKRFILASSNHVVGGHELDEPNYVDDLPYGPAEPIRPDGLYAAAKCFAEAACRSAAELYSLPVSILRLGTVRDEDDPGLHLKDPDFARFGTPNVIRRRLAGSWLYHDDLWKIYEEEVRASEIYRLRFGTSSPGRIWSGDVVTWNPPEVTE